MLARQHLEFVGRPPVLVVDANARALAQRPEWMGYPLALPSDAPEHLKRDAVLAVSIVTHSFVSLQEMLRGAGWTSPVPFYDLAEAFRDRHPLSNGWVAAPMDPAQEAMTRFVLSEWYDDRSRADHLRFLAWRLCREEWEFDTASVDTDNRYFIPEVMPFFVGDARILDGGAYHATFLEAVLKVTGRLSRAWAIEPDRGSAAAIKIWHSSLTDDLKKIVTVVDEVLSDTTGKVQFHDGLGYASQISPTGQQVRTTTTIDALRCDPTIVKLHLEGHELATLKGAEAMLTACRPLLMVTIYHNEDGLFRTAFWLMTQLPRYKFLLRAHGWCGTGVVVYAIPDEKLT